VVKKAVKSIDPLVRGHLIVPLAGAQVESTENAEFGVFAWGREASLGLHTLPHGTHDGE